MSKKVSWDDSNVSVKEYNIEVNNKLKKIKKEIRSCPCSKLCPTEKNDNIIRIAHSRVLYCHKNKLIEEYNVALKNYHLLFNNYSNNYSSDFVLLI
tara:strand:+ start:225 stop:512 length:288 start_codon:yes stop_codon:yes gene_type:complete